MGTSSSSAGGDGGSYPQLIFDYLGISERGACANTCHALQNLIFLPRHSKDTGGRWKMSIWTSLDWIGTRRPAATLKAARPICRHYGAALELEFCRDGERGADRCYDHAQFGPRVTEPECAV